MDGKFLVLSTDDGERWRDLPRDKMPTALPKEGAFAASGTSITLSKGGKIYFGTGGPAARIFRSEDRGRSWTVVEIPIVSDTPSSGVFSVACEGEDDVVAVGGDYKEPNGAKRVAAYSEDSGATWHVAATQPGGFRSAVGFFFHGDFAAVGPNGTDVSRDQGVHWQHTDDLNLNAASFAGTEGWAVGPKGTIARFKTHF
ncbi:MAG: WD40/YVTN/BNR-like repeat-containing protein [Candidatus Acidiferrales bacterium]